MTILEEFRRAVAQGDYGNAQALAARLPQATLEEVEQVQSVLAWAIPMVRIHRAHDAAQLAELIRWAAYRPRQTERRSTWRLEG